jgi:hypothetical protein
VDPLPCSLDPDEGDNFGIGKGAFDEGVKERRVLAV